ncbi:AI-2E family transporter [Streptomyces sp. NBC_00572]|uniref:AI-2E family transporter n=1 Tax=Streptomyces sp. NBC_00572 TaxID=2903664 RepID=UPI0022567CAC|nr:AI-2E family transporter [Streptomyces sp. NBC_00572]MCX4985545.1 AI-2E family transporter [Streptomyces sp. NBC_00572]
MEEPPRHCGRSSWSWVQAIEGNFVQPFIQSRTVSLHPATVMMSVAAGASVAGVLGGVGIVEELRVRAGAIRADESANRTAAG